MLQANPVIVSKAGENNFYMVYLNVKVSSISPSLIPFLLGHRKKVNVPHFLDWKSHFNKSKDKS